MHTALQQLFPTGMSRDIDVIFVSKSDCNGNIYNADGNIPEITAAGVGIFNDESSKGNQYYNISKE